jgi:hypothetical protein
MLYLKKLINMKDSDIQSNVDAILPLFNSLNYLFNQKKNENKDIDRLAFEGVVFLQDYFDRLYCSLVAFPYYLMPILPSLLKGWPTYYI